MSLSKPTTLTAAALAAGLFLLPASQAFAQSPATTPSVSVAAPPAPPNGERPPGNPEDFRARMAERLKTQLKASDDEWTVIAPLLEKTAEKLAATRGGGFGGPGGPGGGGYGGNRGQRRGGDNNGGNQPAASPADNNQGGGNRGQRREGGGGPRGGTPETQALRATLDDDNSTVNDVKAKLQAVRDQRKQAATELSQAREELRKVLNMRQEAALVMDGILD